MAFNPFGIFSAIRSFLGPLGKIWDHLKQTYDRMTNVWSDGQKLVTSIVDEVDAWKNFKGDLRFKQRVINLESAITKTRDLIEGIPAAWRSAVDLVKQFKEQFTGEANPLEEAESATADLESGGFKQLLEKFPALAKGIEKALGFLALLVQALDAITNGIGDIQTIVDECKRIRLEIEKADSIFLQQSNKRKTVKLADGSTMRIRVGNLH